MTAPIPGFQAATPLQTSAYWALSISGTAQSVAIAEAMQAAVTNGYSAGIDVYMSAGVPTWRLRITDANNVDQFGYQGDWLVLQGTTITVMKNADFTAKFSVTS